MIDKHFIFRLKPLIRIYSVCLTSPHQNDKATNIAIADVNLSNGKTFTFTFIYIQ